MQLFIEKKQVDISEKLSTLLTLAIDDIRDFGAKKTTFSKTCVLPGTANNNKLFGNIFQIAAAQDYDSTLPNIGVNFNPSVSASAYIFNDNIQCFKGTVTVMGIVIDRGLIEYEVAFFGELGGFIAAVGSALLTGNLNEDGTPNTAIDLDFSAYNHTYTTANIVGSKSNIGSGSGYVYPLIDYGTYGRDATNTMAGKHNWNYLTFRPALHYREYIAKIFEQSGYTYSCDLFNTARFKTFILPYNGKVLTRKGSDILTMDAPYQLYNDANPGSNLVDFSGLITLFNFTTPDNQTFTYSGTDPFNGTISVQLLIQYIGIGGATFNLYKNGTIVSSAYRTAGTYNFTISASVGLIAGDYIEVEYLMPPHRTLIINDGKLTAIGGNLENIPIYRNRPVVMNDCIPSNVLQKDIISSICKLFNLYVYEDATKDKHLNITPFVDFYNSAISVDWSLKLDRSKPIKIKPMSELTARYYQFDYKKDSDYWNELYEKRYKMPYGSYKYDSNYQLSQESQKVEISFSGTPLVGYQGEDKVYSSIFKRTGSDAAPVEETVDSNIRILQTKLVPGVTSWSILDNDGTTVLGSYTDYPYAGHFDSPDAPTNDLNFGVPNELFFVLLSGSINVNQFNIYWSSYLAEITNKDARMLTATFKLSYKDIYTLDFSKYVHIDGVDFRINKIQDFNATREDTCTVELIKVINKIY